MCDVDSLNYIFRLMALSQVILWCVYCLCFHRTRIGYLVLTLFVGIGFYLASPLMCAWEWDYLVFVTHFFGNLIPAAVWLLAYNLFSDNPSTPKPFIVVSVIYLTLMLTPQSAQGLLLLDEDFLQLLFYFTPQVIKLVLVLHVIYLAVSERKNDLVKQRLEIRIPFACAFAAVTCAVIVTEIGFSDEVPGSVEIFGSVVFFALTLAATLLGIRFMPDLVALFELTAPLGAKTTPAEDENPVIIQIREMMSADRFYANYDVTLEVMAQQLRIPAYKLRPIINQQMGFKNFNQFLNSFRIAEASTRLVTEAQLPILSIALDTGFKSLSAFNKAFKGTHNKTPSEFRQTHLG
jgi:AraC-like DNA-binding protein